MHITFFESPTRLRSSHLDNRCLVSSIRPRRTPVNLAQESSRSVFENSFFYRTHLKWNELPLELREITSPSTFKEHVIRYLWDTLDPNESESENDDT